MDSITKGDYFSRGSRFCNIGFGLAGNKKRLIWKGKKQEKC